MIDPNTPAGELEMEILGIDADTSAQVARAIEDGLDTQTIRRRLLERGYTPAILDEALNDDVEVVLPEPVGPETRGIALSEVLLSLVYHIALAESVFGNTGKAAHWMQRETVQIGEFVGPPILMLRELNGDVAVNERLEQIRHGIYAGSSSASDATGRVLLAAAAIQPDLAKRVHWLRNHPIDTFGGKTATEMIDEDRADDVIAYLGSVSSGFVG